MLPKSKIVTFSQSCDSSYYSLHLNERCCEYAAALIPETSCIITNEICWDIISSLIETASGPIGSRVLDSCWQNIWERWRPLEGVQGLAPLKVKGQRSRGGVPVCCLALIHSAGWLCVIWCMFRGSLSRDRLLRSTLHIYIRAQHANRLCHALIYNDAKIKIGPMQIQMLKGSKI